MRGSSRGKGSNHLTNTRSRDIAQLMLAFSSAREAQLLRKLHRRVRGHTDPSTVRHSVRPCHIQYDFLHELGIPELLFHHLHQHFSLYLCLYLYLYQYLRLFPNLHFRVGLHLTLLDIQCFFLKIPHLVHEISAFTAVDMGMHDHVVSCHPLVCLDNSHVRTRHLARDAD